MTLLTIAAILATTLTGSTSAFEGVLVMLPGVPVQPWSAVTDRTLEEMWTLDVTGYQVTLSGWSGYILMGPLGTGETLARAGALLSGEAFMPDTSAWARLLQLSWRETAMPCVLTYPFQPGEATPPLRLSGLLSGDGDTLVVSAPIGNSVMLRSGLHDRRFAGSAWRGLGLEVVPSSWGGVPVLLAYGSSGSPGELDRLEYQPHSYDSVWAAGFGALLASADSLAAPLAPATPPTLVWVRGTGGADFLPWTFIPSPGPPLRCPGPVAVPGQGFVAPHVFTPPPAAMRIGLPGTLDSEENAEQTAAVIERLVARMILVDHGQRVGITGVSETGWRVALYLENPPWTSPEEALEEITAVLTPLAFTAPEADLISNCAVRASVRLGRQVQPLSARRTAENVARALGLLP